MARLRLGTIGLNAYLSQIGVESNPDCEDCKELEDVHHFLLECPRYTVQREPMVEVASRICPDDITCDLLLCAPSCELRPSEQRELVNAVGRFVRDTGRFPGFPPGSDASL